ncbi:MAG TPA: phosphate butyryltransferase [Tissierellaceae bacterium]|nr:phosphate butyryltransferase [Tissierellaceae bacterium]
MAKNFESLFKLAQEKGPKKMAVAVAQDEDVLGAIKLAYEKGIVEPILVGDSELIQKLAAGISFDISNVQIIDEKDGVEATRKATALVSSGEAQVLMKGLIDTSVIMKAVLDKEIGLRTDSVISHVAVFDVPTYHKVFMVTDAAMIIAPDLDQKKKIIENAVKLAHSLDIAEPKVAVLAAKEKVSPKMEATVHAKELADMNKAGEISGCIVDGPFALDNAVSKESARIKGIDSVVAGDADILLAPDIEAGNVLYKALSFLANAKSAGLIVGTSKPIVLTSRADNEEAKLNSIVLATLMA